MLAHGQWFSPGIPASSTTKTGRHDIVEILLKVALKHQKIKIKSSWILEVCFISFLFLLLILFPMAITFSPTGQCDLFLPTRFLVCKMVTLMLIAVNRNQRKWNQAEQKCYWDDPQHYLWVSFHSELHEHLCPLTSTRDWPPWTSWWLKNVCQEISTNAHSIFRACCMSEMFHTSSLKICFISIILVLLEF